VSAVKKTSMAGTIPGTSPGERLRVTARRSRTTVPGCELAETGTAALERAAQNNQTFIRGIANGSRAVRMVRKEREQAILAR